MLTSALIAFFYIISKSKLEAEEWPLAYCMGHLALLGVSAR